MRFIKTKKAFTVAEIMVVAVIIGLLVAIAIPSSATIKARSQDKEVLNHARQLSGAAEQYYLEHRVSWVSRGNLVGPTNYVKALSLVANETYPYAFTDGVPITVTGVAGVRTITYSP